MKKSVALAGLLFCFLWGMGCAKKKIYLFSPGTGSFRSEYPEPLPHQDPKPTAALPATLPAEPLGPAMQSSDLSAAIAFTELGLYETKRKSLAAASPTGEETSEATLPLPNPTLASEKSQNERKKGTRNPFLKEEQRQNSTGNVGFLISLLSLGLFLINIAAGFSPIVFLVSFLGLLAGTIISRRGISQVKKAPDQYAGKGLATAGFVLGLIGSVLGLIIIIAVMSYGSGQ